MQEQDLEQGFESSEESSSSTSSSSDSGISQVSKEHEEWSYSLFSDILLTLHLGAAAVFLVYSAKNILVDLYRPTMQSFGSHGIMLASCLQFGNALYSLFLRAEILIAIFIILATLYIGRELGNFRVLRIFCRQMAYLLTRFVFYLIIFLHYYCVRIFLERN